MMEARDLYQDLILDHHRAPHNCGPLPHATHRAQGDNPLCGDNVVVSLVIIDDVIEDIRFQGSGCAISQASSSLMTTAVKGKRVREAMDLADTFSGLLTTPDVSRSQLDTLGKLAAFAGVRDFPSRVKCATLPWHAMRAALRTSTGAVTTE